MKSWERLLFREADAAWLNLFRFLFCAGLAAAMWRIHWGCATWYRSESFLGTPPARFWAVRALYDQGFHYLGAAMILALLCAACGWRTRAAVAAAAAAFFVHQWPWQHHFHLNHTGSALIVLALLGLAPGVDVWGIDGRRRRRGASPPASERRVPSWPLFAIRLFVAVGYLSAFYSKLRWGGASWLDGSALQFHMLRAHMMTGSNASLLLANSHWACVLSSWAILLFEGTFVLCVFIPSLTLLYLPASLLFHAGIYGTMSFVLDAFLLCHLAFLDRPASAAAPKGA